VKGVTRSTERQCEWELAEQSRLAFRNKIDNTHLTMCLCLSTQYLIALLTSISCFFVKPFGPTPPLKVIPAVGRKVAVKSCRLLYMLRRSRSSILSLWGGNGGGALSDSRIWSALPACMRWEESLLIITVNLLNISQYLDFASGCLLNTSAFALTRFLYFKIIIFATIESIGATSCICKKGIPGENLVKIKFARLIRKIYVSRDQLDRESEWK